MGREAVQLTTQLTDLAVIEQKKPHDQPWTFSTSMLHIQGEKDCQNIN